MWHAARACARVQARRAKRNGGGQGGGPSCFRTQRRTRGPCRFTLLRVFVTRCGGALCRTLSQGVWTAATGSYGAGRRAIDGKTRYPARADWNAARSGEHAYLIVSAQRRTLSCRNLAAVPAHAGQHRRRTFRQAAIPPTLHLSDRQNGFRVSADPAAPLRREWVARDEGHGHCAEGRLGAHRALDERTRVCD